MNAQKIPPSSSAHKASLLLVDDDRLNLSIMSNSLQAAGYQVNSVESVIQAEQWLDHNPRPDLVLLDMRMPERDGLDLVPRLNASHQVPFILLTAYSEAEIVAKARACGALGYLVKPLDIAQLLPAIETALGRAQDLNHLRQAQTSLQTALDSDRSVSVALGIVMAQHKLNHEAAFDLLRKTARQQHVKLLDLATKLVLAQETINLA